jgi:uncharacterized protein YkwD
MKPTIIAFLIAILLIATMSAPPPTTKADSNPDLYVALILRSSDGSEPTPQPTPEPTRQPIDTAQLKADTIAAVNVERAKAGCAPVSENVDLGNGAQAWSDYMVEHNHIHHSFTIDADWYLNHGYIRSDWVSENVAAGPRTGADVVTLWMSDEGHKATILIGCANTTHTFDAGVGFTDYRWTLAIGELHD